MDRSKLSQFTSRSKLLKKLPVHKQFSRELKAIYVILIIDLQGPEENCC
jgi:hypothetical protein